ncbi:DUF2244 domain-containing protein [Azospirillum sp.]|uniref:DUF2244 domain-containing protein n=1 Tax=Azospirillum sp. TaxID=34012 RepID=UPI002D363758|nr:DUF2244 domain-containing protein [Azospirillum sp.]HYD66100.1 DUF2244 domain-containing protein [Azospirillum sp.]
MTNDVTPPSPRRVFFDAILHPHRSLGRTGFRVLMGGVVLVSAVVGGAFWAMGAWPVTGFFGLDIVVLYWAFRANYRSARLYERVRLTDTDLTVQRVAWKKPERVWTFQPYWLRVSMDDPPRHESQVTLTSHGQSVTVGSFLSPDERLEFAKALNGALTTWRHAPCQPEPVG